MWRSDYYAGGQRVAVRVQGDPAPGSNALYFLLGDHLGSTSITANSSGGFVAEVRYTPWGETRYASGTTPPTFRYTGQREDVSTAGGELYFFRARTYDPVVGRFLSADSIVPEPGNPQSLNRFSYVRNSPIRYTDPTGHRECDIDCQRQNEPVDPIQIHFGEHYYGDCWGASCLEQTANRIESFDIGNIEVQSGYSIDVFLGVGGRADVGAVMDGKGNVGMTLSLGGGGYSAAGAGTGPYVTVYDAPSVEYLEGWAVQVGGQVGQAATVNAEKVFFRGVDRERYGGTSLSTQAQLQGPWPGEIHATATYTWLLFSVNIPAAIADIVRWFK